MSPHYPRRGYSAFVFTRKVGGGGEQGRGEGRYGEKGDMQMWLIFLGWPISIQYPDPILRVKSESRLVLLKD